MHTGLAVFEFTRPWPWPICIYSIDISRPSRLLLQGQTPPGRLTEACVCLRLAILGRFPIRLVRSLACHSFCRLTFKRRTRASAASRGRPLAVCSALACLGRRFRQAAGRKETSAVAAPAQCAAGNNILAAAPETSDLPASPLWTLSPALAPWLISRSEV